MNNFKAQSGELSLSIQDCKMQFTIKNTLNIVTQRAKLKIYPDISLLAASTCHHVIEVKM